MNTGSIQFKLWTLKIFLCKNKFKITQTSSLVQLTLIIYFECIKFYTFLQCSELLKYFKWINNCNKQKWKSSVFVLLKSATWFDI